MSWMSEMDYDSFCRSLLYNRQTKGEVYGINKKSNDEQKRPANFYTSLGTGLGITFGLAFGAAFNQIVMGMVLGLTFGTGIGYMLQLKANK